MSAYLKFFELEQSPFEGKAQASVVLGTRALREAFATIRAGLDEGAARICLSGGAGLGKTSLARALPKLLADSARVAVVLDPSLPWESIRGSISKQWGLDGGGLPRAGLLEAARARRLVLVIDQAEQATEEFLDYLDVILSYRSEDDEPAVQSILLAKLVVNESHDPAPLVWWLDRIQTLQLEFAPLPRDGVESYIRKHLKRAGWRGGELFSVEAALAIHGYTGGIPGQISALCERLLALAAERRIEWIDDEFVHTLFDEEDAQNELVLEDEVHGLTQSLERFERNQSREETLAERETYPSDPEEPEPVDLDQVVSAFDEPFDPDASDFVGASSEFGLGREDSEEFEAEDSDAFRDTALFSIEDDLSRPASPEELRAILGSVFGRHARSIAAAAGAALVGGLLIAWLMAPSRAPEGEPTPPPPGHSSSALDRDSRIGRSTSASATNRFEGDEGGSSEPVLARVRGPVRTATSSDTTAVAVAVAQEPSVLESPSVEAVDDDDELRDDELVDLRPAAMIEDSASPAAADADPVTAGRP